MAQDANDDDNATVKQMKDVTNDEYTEVARELASEFHSGAVVGVSGKTGVMEVEVPADAINGILLIKPDLAPDGYELRSVQVWKHSMEAKIRFGRVDQFAED